MAQHGTKNLSPEEFTEVAGALRSYANKQYAAGIERLSLTEKKLMLSRFKLGPAHAPGSDNEAITKLLEDAIAKEETNG